MNNSKISLRSALCASSALFAVAGLSPAYAQVPLPAEVEAEPEADAEALTGDEAIVITGTRIASPTITSVSPVQIVGEAEIEQSGAANIQEVLLENPVFGTPGLSRTNSAFLTSGTGVATVDLRDLGSDRTLVLINGRRVVSGLPGSATVDLNVIPTDFIDRIDILTGGASSLYGSDAVAGVVNFIYKRDFEGVEANAQYGLTEEGDAQEYQLSTTVGGNFDDDRGNLMVHVGYTNQEGLLSRERENTFTDALSRLFFTGDPADFAVEVEPFFSSFPPQGRFIAGGNTFTFSPTGQLQPCFTTNAATCSSALGTGVGPNGFNRQFFRTLAVPVERYLFAARGHYELTDDITFFAEGTYNNTNASREIEPFPLESGGSNGIFPASGAVPIETVVNGVTVLNPFVPAPIVAVATDTDGDGLRDFAFARRLLEFGTRNGSTNRDFYRFVVGLEGDLFSDRFAWDVSYNYGRTSESQISNGQVNVLNFRNALIAIPDVNDLDNDGSTTDAICADENARAQGCVPINVFGQGAITQEAVNYIAADQTFQTQITQKVVQGNLSGELFDLPAGPLGVAVGVEYREESSFENNDALTNAGLNAGNALPDTAGEFDVSEIYGEVNIPVLSNTPFFQELSLRAAGRISDYSSVGTVYSYSGGVDWRPIEDIRLAATYARSVRAPNIGELFTGPSQTFPPGLIDPCEGVGPTGGGTVGDICRTYPGVLANIAANGVFTLNQADLQGISGFNSGNPDLNEEKSTSYTISAVINPVSIDFLRDVVLRVDYYNIEIDDAIVAPPRQFILDQCFSQADQAFCDLVTRRVQGTAINSPGSIELVNAPLFNGGALKSEGIDVVLNYRMDLDVMGMPGTIDANVAYTHLLEGFVIPIPGADPDPFAGEIGTSEDRLVARLSYANEFFGLHFTGNYIGEAKVDDQFLAGFGLEPGSITVPEEFYLDAQATFFTSDNSEFYLGVDNLLDNDAPLIPTGIPANVTGSDTAADVYDVFGRSYYAGVRLRF